MNLSTEHPPSSEDARSSEHPPPTDYAPPPTVPPPPSGPAPAPEADRRPVVGLRSAVVAAIIAALVAAGVAFPVARSTVANADGSPVPQDPAATSQPVTDSGEPTGATSIADVAAAVSPSVGFVAVSGQNGQGSGSAVIVDTEGHLLTNAHVVDGATAIEVTLPDGSNHTATLVGSDPTSDVAVLRIDATGLPAVDIADSVEVGETVVAIGSPFGLEGSVTSGIVSGIDRTLRGGQGQAALLGMIQTDAAINPGNSGGALVDTQGRLVGVNTAIFSASGTSSGVGFAIPAAIAMATADQLIDTGTVTYAQLGIAGGDVTPALAAAYSLTVEEGALVAEVLPETGAAEAGLLEGDVVVAFDGEPVTSMNQLSALVRTRDPGETVSLGVNRAGDDREVSVALGSAS
jgi:S1-C subfamily serine protease